MTTPSNAMDALKKFKLQEKFTEDSFPGLSNSMLKADLSEMINLATEDFIEIASSPNPTAKKYQEKIKIGLDRFANLYLNLTPKTENEFVCILRR